jgi:hypothetical protein
MMTYQACVFSLGQLRTVEADTALEAIKLAWSEHISEYLNPEDPVTDPADTLCLCSPTDLTFETRQVPWSPLESLMVIVESDTDTAVGFVRPI